MFFKIDVLKYFAIFPGKHLCWSLFLIKLQAVSSANVLKRGYNTGVYSCEYCKIFKNTSFEEHLRTTTSDVSIRMLLVLRATALTSKIFKNSFFTEHLRWLRPINPIQDTINPFGTGKITWGLRVKSPSTCIPLESLLNILQKTFGKGNVYSYRSRDIAVRR